MSLETILEAHKRIFSYVHRTPVVTSSILDELCGRKVFLKCELLQKTGSFKARGALNAVLKLKESNKKSNGVVTHSSGNHGQALAWAAKTAGMPSTVIVPNNTPEIKCTAIKSYGAKLVFCEPSPKSRFETCEETATTEGKTIIPPYDHYDVISGQGTIAVELLEQVPNLDAIIVPVSGGGMTSGIAIATKALSPKTKGKRLWSNPPKFVDTIAEGIRTQQCGQLTFPILCEHVEKEVFTVTDKDMIEGMKFSMKYLKTDKDMIEGMKFSMKYLKLVIEASSGAGIAAVMSDQMKKLDPSLQRIGVILCGGNVDIDTLPW